MSFWDPLILTLKLALTTTGLLFFVAIPIAYWLAQSTAKWKILIETLVSMPLILPPTVLGFYFLLAFGPSSWLGKILINWLGIKLLFSFSGLVFASILYNLPFMVHPIRAGLSALPGTFANAAYLMGRSRLNTLITVLLPNIKPALLTGLILTFAHTIGEFGIVLMIGGNIPQKTKVASVAIYDAVESLQYAEANRYALILVAFAFVVLSLMHLINNKYLNRFWK